MVSSFLLPKYKKGIMEVRFLPAIFLYLLKEGTIRTDFAEKTV
ncbi:hypothetical protein ADIARSV_3659 [Arcticibacter svalbardensis MN12-7]|uniref:Uncharacterized protein n=1 Tax=Arcticibacter svalbardensis MN12-7 TaxID=1150600 RepID=R9GW79_9SPHI|nr:hypothetical protein ADIARSV_3659 [Arcticibacter svalbardensis MN12-7]